MLLDFQRDPYIPIIDKQWTERPVISFIDVYIAVVALKAPP
jgi:hypothetical protein